MAPPSEQPTPAPAPLISRRPGPRRRGLPGRRRVSSHLQPRTLGQALAEFALVLPVLMILLLMAIDAGRLFFGWVNLQNTARIAANYAANYPTASWGPGSEYAAQIGADTTTINCVPQSPLPSPDFPGDPNANPPIPAGDTNLGSPVQVNISCAFRVFTPLIGAITGNPVQLGASAVFPIKAGVIGGNPISGTIPTPTPSPAPTPAPTPTPTPGPTPTPTPKWCTVPTFLGMNLDDAQTAWNNAGFVPSNLTITFYTPPANVGTETPPGKDGTQEKCANFKLTVGP